MTIQGIQIDGQGTFNDVTENAGVVSTAVFAGSASNSGTVSVSAEFGGDSANHGDVTQVAVFAGNAVNTGTVAVAEFRDTAMNAGTVSTSAKFADTSVNTGTVAEAFFADSAVNDGGTVTGNAVFADTSVNSGTVQGDAEVAATATNSGTVGGSVSEYVPPNNNPVAGTVLSTETNYITINGSQYANGTYDVIADGNGGSGNGNYQYAPNSTVFFNESMYSNAANGNSYQIGSQDIVSDGSGGYTYANVQYTSSGTVYYNQETTVVLPNNIAYTSDYNDVVADGSGGFTTTNFQYTASGTVYYYEGSMYQYVADGSGYYRQEFITAGTFLRTETNYVTINGSQYDNGTYDVVADGNGGSNTQNYTSVLPFGTEFGSTGKYSDGNGSYIQWYNPLTDGTNTYYWRGQGISPYDNSDFSNYLFVGEFSLTKAVDVNLVYTDIGSGYQLNVRTDSDGRITYMDLVHWYDDTSSSPHYMTMYGTVTQSDEGGGVKAAQFDGSSGYFNINSFNFDLSEDSTIEFWMKPSSGGQSTILGNASELNVGKESGQTFFINNALADAGTSFGISYDAWSHIAIVTQSGAKYVYHNGVLTTTNGQSFADLTALQIGNLYGYYSGKLAGVRMIAGTAVYTSDFSVPTSLPTNDSGTELLLNFGATAAPTV